MQQQTVAHQNTEAADLGWEKIKKEKEKKSWVDVSKKTEHLDGGSAKWTGRQERWQYGSASPHLRPHWITSASTDPQPVRRPVIKLTFRTDCQSATPASSFGSQLGTNKQTNKHLYNHPWFVAWQHCLLRCCWISPSRCVFTADVDTQTSPDPTCVPKINRFRTSSARQPGHSFLSCDSTGSRSQC